MDGGLHAVVDGRVGEDCLMVQQVALGVEAYHLAARAEAWVDAHDALLAQRSREQQLAQVLGKDADGLLVGLRLALSHELRLYRRQQQALVAVLDSLLQQSAAGSPSVGGGWGEVALQSAYGLIVVDGQAQSQNALVSSAPHGQQAVAGAAFQGFLPVEIVAVFLGFVAVFFALDHLRLDEGLAAES